MYHETPAYTITKPTHKHIPQLRALWKDVFGDTDAFLDLFFSTAFSLQRCRCVLIDNHIVSALYWFDCHYQGKTIAYIYAVATSPNKRGQGLCHALMDNTHIYLKEHGYEGALLSPASPALFHFYEKMDYQTCAYHDELVFSSETRYAYEKKNFSMRSISTSEFASLRKKYLPTTALIQENENLDFLETQADFYAGEGFLLTARKDGTNLFGIEFLGNTSVIPSILNKLACTSGIFRTPGQEKAFGMYRSFTNNYLKPDYLGFAFD